MPAVDCLGGWLSCLAWAAFGIAYMVELQFRRQHHCCGIATNDLLFSCQIVRCYRSVVVHSLCSRLNLLFPAQGQEACEVVLGQDCLSAVNNTAMIQ